MEQQAQQEKTQNIDISVGQRKTENHVVVIKTPKSCY